MRTQSAFVVVTVLLVWGAVPAANVLFDATQHEMAGNADWVVDADAWNLNTPRARFDLSVPTRNGARVYGESRPVEVDRWRPLSWTGPFWRIAGRRGRRKGRRMPAWEPRLRRGQGHTVVIRSMPAVAKP